MPEFTIPNSADVATVSVHRIDFDADGLPVAVITDQHPEFPAVHAHILRHWQDDGAGGFFRKPVGTFEIKQIDDEVMYAEMWTSQTVDLPSYIRLIGVGYEYTLYNTNSKRFNALVADLEAYWMETARSSNYGGGILYHFKRQWVTRKAHEFEIKLREMRQNTDNTGHYYQLKVKDQKIRDLRAQIDTLSRKLYNDK